MVQGLGSCLWLRLRVQAVVRDFGFGMLKQVAGSKIQDLGFRGYMGFKRFMGFWVSGLQVSWCVGSYAQGAVFRAHIGLQYLYRVQDLEV